jgi:hypothetical protein
MIDREKFAEWLGEVVSDEAKTKIKQHPKLTKLRPMIEHLLQDGNTIWTRITAIAQTYRQQGIDSFGAHPSTQHNNERHVKRGALFTSTGKSEIWTSIYAV